MAKKYVPKEQVEKAKQIDLISYFQMTEPYNLKRISATTYCLKTHDSLTMKADMWHWWSRGIGGRNALDYLTRALEMDFVDAVIELTGEPDKYVDRVKINKAELSKEEKRELMLPAESRNPERLIRYLKNRGICDFVIRDFLKHGYIYEDGKYHNAVFVGYNEDGKAAYGAVRSTGGKVYKMDCRGSDKSYSFKRPADYLSDEIHVFEGAVDLMSYATMMLYLVKRDYRKVHLLSLSGIYQSGYGPATMPKALDKYISAHPEIRKVHLHLDNDEPGRNATEGYKKLLTEMGFEAYDEPAPYGKDINDFLMFVADQKSIDPPGKDRVK